MKKPSFPKWTVIFILVMSLFFLGFYLNGKLVANYSWNDDLGKVLCTILAFFYISFNVGVEWSKIVAYVRLAEKMGLDEHHKLYEYLQNYLARYNTEERPTMDFLKKVFLIRLTHLNYKKPIESVTNEICQLCSHDEKERIIQLNMLIDHWISEFVTENNEKIRIFNKRIKKNKNKVKEILMTDDMQFHVTSFLLTNVCHETINVEFDKKFS